jgi:putative addiction module component (TIGR02574 family)
MSPSLDDLKVTISALAPAQRVELAHFLLESLEPQEEGWAEAWREELVRRLEEIRSGQVVGVPAEEVLQQLSERYP